MVQGLSLDSRSAVFGEVVPKISGLLVALGCGQTDFLTSMGHGPPLFPEVDTRTQTHSTPFGEIVLKMYGPLVTSVPPSNIIQTSLVSD